MIEDSGWSQKTKQNKTKTFLDAIFQQVPIFLCQNLLISVNNIVFSIFPENDTENNHTVFKLQLFEKVNGNYLWP